MTREQVTQIFPDATGEQLSGLLKLHHTEAQEGRQSLAQLETERDGLQAQLTAANDTIRAYQEMDIDGIRKQAADWEQKYNADTAALREELSGMRYDQAAAAAMQKLQFSSGSARKAFMQELKAKGLEVKDGALTGFDAFVEAYQAADPDAFRPEVPDPSFSQGNGAGGPPAGSLSAAALAAKAYSAKFSR